MKERAMIKIESKIFVLEKELQRLNSELSSPRISEELTRRCISSVEKDIEVHKYIKKLIDEDKDIH